MNLKLLVIAVFGFAAIAQAKTNPSLSITRKDSSSIYLINYVDSKIGKVTLTIKDEQGNTMVNKIIQNQNGFLLPVNFSSLPEGIYLVQVDNGMNKQSVSVNYNTNTEPTYSHVINLGDDRYLFSSSHAGKEIIAIKIYDGNDVLVFNEDRTIERNFSMLFNLKNISGEPSFEVSGTSGNSLMVPGNPPITVVNKIEN